MFKLARTRKPQNPTPFEDTSDALLANSSDYIQYAAFFLDNNGNFGDRIIPRLGLDLINTFLKHPPCCLFSHVRSTINPLHQSNSRQLPKALIIGPGGLISGNVDSKKKSDQKWFVNFNAQEAKVVRDSGIPIYFWGTGVNRWSRKRLFTDEIKHEISEIFDNTEMAFLRGRADIDFLKTFLPVSCHEKLRFQACPSFFIPELRNVKQRETHGARRVAINIAADQLAEYFLLSIDKITNWQKVKRNYYQQFADFLKPFLEFLASRSLTPIFFCSTTEDSVFAQTFFSDYQRIDTNKISSAYVELEQIISTFDYAVGMRLHAWLPFVSLGIPSLFLTPFEMRAEMPKDLGLDQLTCYLKENSPADLASKFEDMLANEEKINNKIINARQTLFEESKKNVLLMTNNIGLE